MSPSQDPPAKAVGAAVPPMDELEEVAADWIARRNGDGWSAAEQADLNAWLAADARHAQAFGEMETAWATLNEPRLAGSAGMVWKQIDQRLWRRRWTLATAAGLAAAAVFLVGLWWENRPAAGVTPTVASSIVMRSDVRTLPDGSTVELNAGADIAIAFTEGKRGVRLLRGEALFAVAKDAARPFVVAAGAVEVRAVGTSFAVRHEPDRINVLVATGRVAVERVEEPAPPAAPLPVKAEPIYLDVGGQAIMPVAAEQTWPAEIKTVSPAALAAALAWRDKRIEFVETPLAEAVKMFNGQNRIQLTLADRGLEPRLVTGIIWADDPEGFVRLLETGFGIRAERQGDVIKLRGE